MWTKCRFECGRINCANWIAHHNAVNRIYNTRFLICGFAFSTLTRDSNPVLILKPAELAGMSLENRLMTYDWENQFDVFQRVTRNGSFRPICLDAKNNILSVSTNYTFPVIDNTVPLKCSSKSIVIRAQIE